MILKYGSYAHADAEVAIVMTRQALESDRGEIFGYVERWNLSGRLHAASQAAVTTALANLERAYAKQGQDLVLFLSNGSTRSQHQLLNSACMGGVRVTQPPSYDRGTGAEYSTYRHYQIAVEGDVLTAPSNILLSWEQEIEIQGSPGPEVVLVPVIRGPWPRQQVTEKSVVTTVQSGSAVGLTGYPAIPPPIEPGNEITTMRRVRQRSPRLRGKKTWEYPVSWSYTFQSTP